MKSEREVFSDYMEQELLCSTCRYRKSVLMNQYCSCHWNGQSEWAKTGLILWDWFGQAYFRVECILNKSSMIVLAWIANGNALDTLSFPYTAKWLQHWQKFRENEDVIPFLLVPVCSEWTGRGIFIVDKYKSLTWA